MITATATLTTFGKQLATFTSAGGQTFVKERLAQLRVITLLELGQEAQPKSVMLLWLANSFRRDVITWLPGQGPLSVVDRSLRMHLPIISEVQMRILAPLLVEQLRRLWEVAAQSR